MERECGTCKFEKFAVDEKPCLDCEIRDRWDNWQPKENKMGEKMKFHEAREKAEKGDQLCLKIPAPLGEFETKITVGEEGEFRLTWELYESDQWQIIRAEPKVLSINDLSAKIIIMEKHGHFKMNRQDIQDVAEMCHKNGRLERDIELRPLLENIIDNWDSLKSDGYECLIKIYENLKPLNKDD